MQASVDTSPTNPTEAATPSIYLFAARAIRDFGDGFVAVLLPVYLTAIGLGPFEIGVVATLALLGSSLMTLGIGYLGARTDVRQLLIGAALLMFGTGLAFAAAQWTPLIYLIAFVGTINPSAGSASIFAPLEQTILSGSVSSQDRTRIFARYSLTGAMAAATGALCSGSPELLQKLGIDRLDAIRTMFVIYGFLGVLGALCYARLPKAPEAAKDAPKSALGPSRTIVYKLAALFSVDSFAGGFAVQALVALWLFHKFNMSLAAAGMFFFWTGVLAAFSHPVAAWLSRRIGLVNTMVFTHIPSSVCMILAAIAPTLEIALALLLVRAALSQMDIPTRNSYVMAVVTPPERPAAASVTAVPRGLATAISPAIAGWLFQAGYMSLPLIICAVLKIAYDLALLWMFRHIKPPEEQ